jgi:hypothetical protein
MMCETDGVDGVMRLGLARSSSPFFEGVSCTESMAISHSAYGASTYGSCTFSLLECYSPPSPLSCRATSRSPTVHMVPLRTVHLRSLFPSSICIRVFHTGRSEREAVYTRFAYGASVFSFLINRIRLTVLKSAFAGRVDWRPLPTKIRTCAGKRRT